MFINNLKYRDESLYTHTHKCVGHADVGDTALPCIEQGRQVQVL